MHEMDIQTTPRDQDIGVEKAEVTLDNYPSFR